MSKACAEAIGFSYHRTAGLEVCAARCTNLYGGGDPRTGRIVPGAVDAVLRGDPPVIRGDGRARRDYLHVDDAVRGFLAVAEAMERPGVSGQAFNLASEEVVDVRELVDTILSAGGRRDLRPQVLGEPTNEPPVTRVSAGKARRVLGWAARVSLEAGIRETVDWHRAATAPPVSAVNG